MPMDWPWYQAINSGTDLQQGDILEEVTVRSFNRSTRIVEEEKFDLVVMTQSCDIEDELPYIVFCPLWTRDQAAEFHSGFKNRGTVGHLLRGRLIGFYPINRCDLPGLQRPWRIVQFQRLIELERDDVLDQLGTMGERIRILPPYRESLAQQFARFFMRVGLPVPVDVS